MLRSVARSAVAAQRRTAMTKAAHEYSRLKDKIERHDLETRKVYKHSPFLNARDKNLNDVWWENAVFYYSLALTPFLALFYLQ